VTNGRLARSSEEQDGERGARSGMRDTSTYAEHLRIVRLLECR